MDGSRDRIYLIINGNGQFSHFIYPLNNVVLMVAELLRRYVPVRVMATQLAIFENLKLQNYTFLFNCNTVIYNNHCVCTR